MKIYKKQISPLIVPTDGSVKDEEPTWYDEEWRDVLKKSYKLSTNQKLVFGERYVEVEIPELKTINKAQPGQVIILSFDLEKIDFDVLNSFYNHCSKCFPENIVVAIPHICDLEFMDKEMAMRWVDVLKEKINYETATSQGVDGD